MPSKSDFQTFYAGKRPPWDIGRPQKPFIDVADQITGSVLDAGCGTGENALFFASRGNKVTGIDFLEEADPAGQSEGSRSVACRRRSWSRTP